jgi:hypothetical protein
MEYEIKYKIVFFYNNNIQNNNNKNDLKKSSDTNKNLLFGKLQMRKNKVLFKGPMKDVQKTT